MGQGLKGASFTYSQYGDLVFGPLPPNSQGVVRMPSILGDHGDTAFLIYIDNYGASATTFDELFDFLHTKYFPRCAFGPVYLAPAKTILFGSSMELLGFEGSKSSLRPSNKHKKIVGE